MGTGALTSFFSSNLGYVYFFYGLAFFSMGLSLIIESRRASQFRFAQAGHSLGLFGILHGSHEFWEMFVILQDKSFTVPANIVRVTLLSVSFLPLIVFGVQMLPRSEKDNAFTIRMLIFASIAFIMQITLIRATHSLTTEEWLQTIDVLARYMLAIPGAALSGLALMRQRRVLLDEGLDIFGRDLGLAALALAWYGIIGQAFPQESIIFPSMFINSALFLRWFGFPVQVLRSVMAVLTAIAMIRALRAFDEEMRQKLEVARQTEMDLQSAARELSLLYEASSLLSSTYDLDVVLQKSIHRIVEAIEPVQAGFIIVNIDSRMAEEYYAAYGISEAQLALYKQGALCQCVGQRAATDRSCWADKDNYDVTHEVEDFISSTPYAKKYDIQKIVMPLQSGAKQVGTILLETLPEGPYLSSGEAPTIIALTRQLAIAIDNAILVLELRQREARRSELLHRTTEAQEAERKRIARELHDETGQALTALALGLKGTQKLLDSDLEQAFNQIAHLKEISTTALEELRHLISDLRPAHLDDLGMVAALRWYAEEIGKRSEISVQFTVHGDVYRLLPETETTLFRIAQEGLNNITKHARAQKAQMHLDFSPTQVELQITDDGIGFNPEEILKPGAGRAWGLIGIQERVTLAQGYFRVKSVPGKGTTLFICIPTSSDVQCEYSEREMILYE